MSFAEKQKARDLWTKTNAVHVWNHMQNLVYRNIGTHRAFVVYHQQCVVDEFFDGFNLVLLPATLKLRQNIFGGDGWKRVQEATLRYAQIQRNYLSINGMEEKNKSKWPPNNGPDGAILATCVRRKISNEKKNSSKAEIWRRQRLSHAHTHSQKPNTPSNGHDTLTFSANTSNSLP